MLCSRKDQDVVWELPEPEDHIVNLKEAIGHYPSIDPRVKEGMQETLKLFPDFGLCICESMKYVSSRVRRTLPTPQFIEALIGL